MGPPILISDAIKKYRNLTELHVLGIRRSVRVYGEGSEPVPRTLYCDCEGHTPRVLGPGDLLPGVPGWIPKCKACGRVAQGSELARIAACQGRIIAHNAEVGQEADDELKKEAEKIRKEKGLGSLSAAYTYIALRRLRVDEHEFEEALLESYPGLGESVATGSPDVAQTTKAPSQPKQNLWSRFVESIFQGAGNELGKWLLSLFGFILLLGVGGVVYWCCPPSPPAPDAPGWHLIAHRFSREAWEGGSGAYAVYTKEGERFDLSKAQWIRVTFEASQAGTKFFLRLLPKGEIPDASTGVYKEVLSIPAEGVVVLPLKPTDFLLKPADLHQLIQISVHSGDNAWGEPLGQEPSKRAKFEKIEVYTP